MSDLTSSSPCDTDPESEVDVITSLTEPSTTDSKLVTTAAPDISSEISVTTDDTATLPDSDRHVSISQLTMRKSVIIAAGNKHLLESKEIRIGVGIYQIILPTTLREKVWRQLHDLRVTRRVPKAIHMDQGTKFATNLTHRFKHLLGARNSRTAPCRPQSDGLSKHVSGNFLKIPTESVTGEKTDWDNNSPQITSSGRDANLPVDLMLLNQQSPIELPRGVEYIHLVRTSFRVARDHAQQSAIQQMKGDDPGTVNERRSISTSPAATEMPLASGPGSERDHARSGRDHGDPDCETSADSKTPRTSAEPTNGNGNTPPAGKNN